jgi:hypothetical protein
MTAITTKGAIVPIRRSMMDPMKGVTAPNRLAEVAFTLSARAITMPFTPQARASNGN